MRRLVFKLEASGVQDMQIRSEHVWLDGDARLRKFLADVGFDLNRAVQQHTQCDGGILFVQNIPLEGISTFDMVCLILWEAGFPKERTQDVLMRAWEENRDPVEIAKEEVALVKKLEG